MSSSTLVTPAPAGVSTWTIDPAHSEMGFAVRHLMISTVKGRFSGVSGTVHLDSGDLASATVEASIDVSTIDTREPQRDAHLRSGDFFDVERFPTITYKSRRVQPQGADRYTLVGDLTIHGVTREVTLDVVPEGSVRDPWGNERLGFSAKGEIDRRDFGVTWNQTLDAGGFVLGDRVKLALDVELIKQQRS